jgi:hypothetical protein
MLCEIVREATADLKVSKCRTVRPDSAPKFKISVPHIPGSFVKKILLLISLYNLKINSVLFT